jgi:hypothetical protein
MLLEGKTRSIVFEYWSVGSCYLNTLGMAGRAGIIGLDSLLVVHPGHESISPVKHGVRDSFIYGSLGGRPGQSRGPR